MIKWFKRKKKLPDLPTEADQEQFETSVTEISEVEPNQETAAGPAQTAAEEEQREPESASSASPAREELGVAPERVPTEGALPTESAATPESLPADAKPRFFRRLRQRLSRTRQALGSNIDRLFLGHKTIDLDLLDQLEELLITADLGVETSIEFIERTREKVKRKELTDPARLKAHLKEEMLALLAGVISPPLLTGMKPQVVMVIGVNGVGKTTTIAKLAHHDTQEGKKVMLVAADTFRAAAVEQLEIWGQRVGVPVIKQKTGADPAAVVFDGLQAALAREVDTVYIDTAGRLHTKINLMEELKKVRRTAEKKIMGAPHEVLLVLDATTGQNAISQARLFHEAIGVTGIVMTKLDGTAKGGVALGVVKETGLPIRFIGVGEQMDDLRPFDPEAYLEAIIG